MMEVFDRLMILDSEIAKLNFHLDCFKNDLRNHIDNVEQIIEQVEWILAHKMNELYDMKRSMYRPKNINEWILYLKQTKGYTLERIAKELGYSRSYIKRRHAEIKRRELFAERWGNS